jgi:hypothetical protein
VPAWLDRLIPRRGRALHTLPLGVEGELPWHSSVTEVRRVLRRCGALSLDLDGYPTARLRWGDLTVRAQLEFVSGVHVGEATWLSAHPTADFFTRDGLKVKMEPRLRAANIHFPFRDRRGNWAKAIELLGKPHGKQDGAAWKWAWRDMTARFADADMSAADSTETLRFEARSGSRVLEVRNQSPLELYDKLNVRIDFRAGTWRMGERPPSVGVPLRVHWDVPRHEPVLVTAFVDGREVTAEVTPRGTKVVITSDGQGGVRLIV